jgi:hypothetical protein
MNSEAKRAYHAAYYAAHREKAAVDNRARYLANREKILKQCTAYRAAHHAEKITRDRAYWAANRNKMCAQKRAYYAAHSIESAKFRAAHRGEIATYNHAYSVALRQAALTHYGRKCARCGEQDITKLHLHHIHFDGIAQRKVVGKGFHFLLWLKKNHYPKGLQVLCISCHKQVHDAHRSALARRKNDKRK